MFTRLRTFRKSWRSFSFSSSFGGSGRSFENENEVTPILSRSPSHLYDKAINRGGDGIEDQRETDDEDAVVSFMDLIREVCIRGKAWRVIPLLFIIGIAFSMILPALPSACTQYYAKRNNHGKDVKCEDFMLDTLPPSCQNAHWQCIEYQSIWLFLNNSIMSFFLAPIFGKLSDTYGRKKFLILGTALCALPVYSFYGTYYGYGNYLYAYPLLTLGMSFGPLSASLAYVSDSVQRKYRTQALGMVLGEFFFGIIIGPPLSKFSDQKTNAFIACIFATGALVYSMTIPESLKPKTKQFSAASTSAASHKSWRELASELTKLSNSKFFVLMSIIAIIGSFTSEGSMEITSQYLQLTSGFTTEDQANLLTMVGLSGLIIQFFLLPQLMSIPIIKTHEKVLIACTNLLLVFTNVGMAFVGEHKALAVTLQAVSYLGIMSFTVSTGMLSKAVSENHQGLVTGVISGLRSQACGIGPVVYSKIFKAFTSTSAAGGDKLPYMPGAPYLLSAFLMFLSAILATQMESNPHIPID